jgi:hypothetical protein
LILLVPFNLRGWNQSRETQGVLGSPTLLELLDSGSMAHLGSK